MDDQPHPDSPSGAPSATRRVSPDVTAGPLFLHSMWRTGSTFVFGKFRENARFRCFYEPLNEALATLNERAMARVSGQAAARRLGHAQMQESYYDEYRPFLRRWLRGVRRFRYRFAFRDFFRDPDEALAEYFGMLIASAQAEGRQAMFKFCRSYGRIGGFRLRFPGRHLYLLRNPRDQWQSYLRRRYFMEMTCVIAGLRPEHAAGTTGLSAQLEQPLPPPRDFSGFTRRLSLGRYLSPARRYLRIVSLADKYRIFCHEWRLARQLAEQHCECVIDVDRVSTDATYREQVADNLGVRLDGCQIKHYQQYELPLEQMQEIEARSQLPECCVR